MNHLIACTKVGFSYVPYSLVCHSFSSSFLLFSFSFLYSIGLFSLSSSSLFPFSLKAPPARLQLQPLHPISSHRGHLAAAGSDCWLSVLVLFDLSATFITPAHLFLLETLASLSFWAPSQLGKPSLGSLQQNLFFLVSKCWSMPGLSSSSSSLLHLHPLPWWSYPVSRL